MIIHLHLVILVLSGFSDDSALQKKVQKFIPVRFFISLRVLCSILF